jgi:hypothetical protein
MVNDTRYYESSIRFHDETGGGLCAIEASDGSWWIDWGRLELMRATKLAPTDALILRLLFAARGGLKEVTEARMDELALEAGRSRPPPVMELVAPYEVKP